MRAAGAGCGWLVVVGVSMLLAGGCGTDHREVAKPPPPGALTEPNVAREPAVTHASPRSNSRRTSVLLDFETARDLAFVRPNPSIATAIDARKAFSGARSLRIERGGGVDIKLPTLLHGRPFPVDWTLLGAYVYCDRAVEVTVSCGMPARASLTRTIALAAHVWSPVMLDLTTADFSRSSSEAQSVGELRFSFLDPAGGAAGVVWIDDLMLIDNHEVLVDSAGVAGAGAWRVKRRGLNYIVDVGGARLTAFALPTVDAEAGGWEIVETGSMRARFSSLARPHTLALYADGRAYWGGEFDSGMMPARDPDIFAAQHASPAELRIPTVMGRVNRGSPGDLDNDGYNESRGAYQLVAAGARVEVTIIPRTPLLLMPVLEVSGLPPGKARVTMEGRLLSEAERLSNGDLLVTLPGRLQRPTLVNISIP